MYKNKDIHLRYRFFLLVLNKPLFIKIKIFAKNFTKMFCKWRVMLYYICEYTLKVY